MKFINSSIKYIPQEGNTLIDLYKHIEKCARTCYQSADKISDDSWRKLINILTTNQHLSTFEHATVYLRYDSSAEKNIIDFYKSNKHSVVNEVISDYNTAYFVTTNLRVIHENDRYSDLSYMCDFTNFHEPRYTFKVMCSIGTSMEWNRHRTISISQESTRYCLYSKDKFDNELTYVVPEWVNAICSCNKEDYHKEIDNNAINKAVESNISVSAWYNTLKTIEQNYLLLTNEEKLSAQNARDVLPKALKTEICYTATKSDWEKFIELRNTEFAHPDIRVLAKEIKRIIDEEV